MPARGGSPRPAMGMILIAALLDIMAMGMVMPVLPVLIHCLASLAGIVGPVLFGWIYALSSQSLPGLAFAGASAMVLAGLLCSVWVTASARKAVPVGEMR